jgi:hypothetical protein
VINFSAGSIYCRICRVKWYIEGRTFDAGNIEKINKFREKHKNCKK